MMHEGHRKRMLERMKNAGGELQDHELLEVLLFYSIPRKNTNEIAHALLSAFGSLGAVFRANYDQLLCVNGVGEVTAAFLTGIGQCMKRAERESDERPVAFSYEMFSAQIKDRYKNVNEEIVELYKLDSKNRISFVKPLTSNQIDKASFAAEEISRFLVASHPNAILIVHNHLGESYRPSRQDDVFTRQVQLLCSMHNVELYDHMIVSSSGLYSYFLSGDLEKIKDEFNMKKFFGEQKT